MVAGPDGENSTGGRRLVVKEGTAAVEVAV